MKHIVKDFYVAEDGTTFTSEKKCEGYDNFLAVIKREKPFKLDRDAFVRILDAACNYSSMTNFKWLSEKLKGENRNVKYEDFNRWFDKQTEDFPKKTQFYLRKLIDMYYLNNFQI